MQIVAAMAVAALILGAGPVAAQHVTDVAASASEDGTTVSGSVTGAGHADYRVSAGANQTLFAELTVSGEDVSANAYFDVLPPGGGQPIYNSTDGGNEAVVDLGDAGTYTVRVYLTGAERDGGATVTYDLNLSVR